MAACTYEQMMALIAAQTATLTEKIEVVQSNVKSDIKNAVDPVIERQNELEVKTAKQYDDMAKQYDDMAKQITQIHESLALSKHLPNHNPSSLSPAPVPASTYAQSIGAGYHTSTGHQTRSSPVPNTSHGDSDGSYMEVVNKAERTIGFQPYLYR